MIVICFIIIIMDLLIDANNVHVYDRYLTPAWWFLLPVRICWFLETALSQQLQHLTLRTMIRMFTYKAHVNWTRCRQTAEGERWILSCHFPDASLTWEDTRYVQKCPKIFLDMKCIQCWEGARLKELATSGWANKAKSYLPHNLWQHRCFLTCFFRQRNSPVLFGV